MVMTNYIPSQEDLSKGLYETLAEVEENQENYAEASYYYMQAAKETDVTDYKLVTLVEKARECQKKDYLANLTILSNPSITPE